MLKKERIKIGNLNEGFKGTKADPMTTRKSPFGKLKIAEKRKWHTNKKIVVCVGSFC